jgi:hypothetical protein
LEGFLVILLKRKKQEKELPECFAFLEVRLVPFETEQIGEKGTDQRWGSYMEALST